MLSNDLYIKLLSKRKDEISKALVFYLKKECIQGYAKKFRFVERVVHYYMEIQENEGETTLEGSIPEEIADKIVAGYKEDYGKYEEKAKERLIKEMENIF